MGRIITIAFALTAVALVVAVAMALWWARTKNERSERRRIVRDYETQLLYDQIAELEREIKHLRKERAKGETP